MYQTRNNTTAFVLRQNSEQTPPETSMKFLPYMYIITQTVSYGIKHRFLKPNLVMKQVKIFTPSSNLLHVYTTDSGLAINRAVILVPQQEYRENKWRPFRETVKQSGLETEVTGKQGWSQFCQARLQSGGGYGNDSSCDELTQQIRQTSNISPEPEDNLTLRPM